jgi:hypothetical protein
VLSGRRLVSGDFVIVNGVGPSRTLVHLHGQRAQAYVPVKPHIRSRRIRPDWAASGGRCLDL